MKRLILSLSIPLLITTVGCDSEKAGADKDKKADAKKDDKAGGEKAEGGEKTVEAPKDEPAPADDGLDPSLDNSALDDTGKAIAKLWDASKECAFNDNGQISGCKPYDEFRTMQKGISPMTQEFADQRDAVVVSRLASKEATVRAWSLNFSSNLYRASPDHRKAIEDAFAAETDTIATRVGIFALGKHIKDNPSLQAVFEKHAASSVPEVAEPAQKALDKAAN